MVTARRKATVAGFPLLLLLLGCPFEGRPSLVAALRRNAIALPTRELPDWSVAALEALTAGPFNGSNSSGLLEVSLFQQANLTQTRARVRTLLHRTQESIQDHPDYVFVAAWVVAFLLCASRIWLTGGTEYEAKSLEVRKRRDTLQGAYIMAMADIEGILMNMSESAVSLAEWNFNEKRTSFLRCLGRLADDPSKFFPNPTKNTVDAFRNFVSLWLRIYEECTEDPMQHPKRVVEQAELNSCKKVPDIVRLVSKRLDSNPVAFMRRYNSGTSQASIEGGRTLCIDDGKKRPWLELVCGFGCSRRARTARSSSEAEGHESGEAYPVDYLIGCIKLTLLSETHCAVLLTYMIGLILFAAELALYNWFFVCVIGIKEVYLFTALYRIKDIDEISALQREVAHLEKMSEEVKAHRNMLIEFYTNLRDLNTLWQYRTLPCLEHLEAIAEHFLMHRDSSFMSDASRIWCHILEGLGDVPLWMDNRIDEEVLAFAAEQLKSATEFVHENRSRGADAILQRLSRVFGFVVVRVRAAKNLTNKGLNKLVTTMEPYVTISFSEDKKPLASPASKQSAKDAPFRTEKSSKSGTDPIWEDEEFTVPVEWFNGHLQLHVWDGNSHNENVSLGFYNINFRDLTVGVWHERCEFLTSAKKGTEQQSQIEFDIFFADEVRQLDWADNSREASLNRLSDWCK